MSLPRPPIHATQVPQLPLLATEEDISQVHAFDNHLTGRSSPAWPSASDASEGGTSPPWKSQSSPRFQMMSRYERVDCGVRTEMQQYVLPWHPWASQGPHMSCQILSLPGHFPHQLDQGDVMGIVQTGSNLPRTESGTDVRSLAGRESKQTPSEWVLGGEGERGY